MTLVVESRGNGRDLVLLHGWGTGSTVWGEFADRLAQRFRLHVVDMPGYGASTGTGMVSEPCTLHALCAQLAPRLPARTAVCGWSLGGQVALHWAMTAPQQVEHVVLIATTPCFVERADWAHGMSRQVFGAFEHDFEHDCAQTLARFAALQAHGDAHAETVRAQLRHAVSSRPPDVAALAAGLRILRDTDLRDTLAVVRQPVLAIHGRCDALVPPAAARWLGNALSEGRTHLIDECAHAPFLSQPETAATLITDFLNG